MLGFGAIGELPLGVGLAYDASGRLRANRSTAYEAPSGESLISPSNLNLVVGTDESEWGDFSFSSNADNQLTHRVMFLDFGRWRATKIPSEATITGIEVSLYHWADHFDPSGYTYVTVQEVALVVNGEVTEATLPAFDSPTTSRTQVTTGGENDTGGLSLSGEDEIGFAVQYAAHDNQGNSNAVRFNQAAMKIWYTLENGIIAEVATATIKVSAIAPTTAKSAALPAAGLRVNAFAPGTNKIAPLPAAGVKVSGVAPATAKIAPLPTAGVGVNGITPATAKTASVPAAGVGVSARAPATAKQTAVPTATVEITSHAPTTLKAADVPTAGISIAAQPLDGGTVANVPTAGIAVAVVAPSTAKLAQLPTAGIEVAAREPATAKAAAVPTATVQVEGLAPTVVYVAAVPTAVIEIHAVEPGTAKAAAVMPGQVVVLAMPMVEPIIVTARATAYLPVHGADPRIITVYGVDIRPLDVTGTSPVPREVKG